MSRLDKIAGALERIGKKYRHHGNRITCQCPAHDDSNPSFEFKEKPDGRVTFNCYSQGCTWDEVLGALGLDPEDFYVEQRHYPAVRPIRRDPSIDELVIEIARADRQSGKSVSERDKARELQAFKSLRQRGISIPTGTPTVDEIQHEAYIREHVS